MAKNPLRTHTSLSPRAGWEQQYLAMAENCDDPLLDELSPTLWDEEEWQWE
jgi:antitoxin MazE